jgi:type VI secretion system protein ImpG
VGFAREQALIPYTTRSFSGYRLLHEYFAFPERFRFVELAGLRKALTRHGGDEIELVIPLARSDGALGALVDKAGFALHCTPAVNLISRHADRIHVSDQQAEHHVVVDRTKRWTSRCTPSSTSWATAKGWRRSGSFARSTRRSTRTESIPRTATSRCGASPAALSERQRRDGSRTSYMGSEVSLSLVDSREAPYSETLRQLAVDVLVTNRDLPLLMPVGSDRDFSLAISAPVDGIRCLRGPSRPRAAILDGEIPWRLTSHLSLNYLTVADLDEDQGATALREFLELYADLVDADMPDAISRRQTHGVRRVSVTPRTRRLPAPGPIVFGRGLEIRVTVDETSFAGASAFLLGAVLEQVFARLASMNTFTELVLVSERRGEIKRWPPRMAARQLV